MKFFAFIMALLVLALSVLPCADEGFIVKTGKASAGITEQHNQHEEQNHNDACSPFCHCTCCSGFSINHFFNTNSSPILIDSKIYTSYLQGDLIEYSYPIWQPPQLKV